MHTRTKRAQRKHPPFCITLPRDLFEVKIIAFVQAMTNAYVAHREKKPLIDDISIQVMGIESCFSYEKRTVDGKQMTNDIPLFRETYLRTYKPVHRAMIRLLETASAASVLDSMDSTQLARYLHSYALAHPSLIDDAYLGVSITLPALSTHEQTNHAIL